MRKKGKKRMKTVDKCIQELEYVKSSIDEIELKVNEALEQISYIDSVSADVYLDTVEDCLKAIKGIIGGCLYEN